MQSEAILFEEIKPSIGLITMNRPDKLNAINEEFVDSYDAVMEKLQSNDSIRVVILTGAGRGFCSGADLTEVVSRAGHEVFTSAEKFLLKVQERFSNLVMALRRIPQPVIAAVNGPAAGGGFALALGSDIRLASPGAFFVASFINIGLSAGEMGSSYLLPRLVGMSRAAEILFTGRRVPADEAERIGLVSRLVPQEKLLDEAVSIAQTMLQKTPGGLLLTKRVLDLNASAPSLAAAVEVENRNQTIMAVSSEFFKMAKAALP